MQRAIDMFPAPELKRPKSKRNMHAIDAGTGPADEVIALMECPTCGHDDGWWTFDTWTKMRRGVPCPVCNGKPAQPEESP